MGDGSGEENHLPPLDGARFLPQAFILSAEGGGGTFSKQRVYFLMCFPGEEGGRSGEKLFCHSWQGTVILTELHFGSGRAIEEYLPNARSVRF